MITCYLIIEFLPLSNNNNTEQQHKNNRSLLKASLILLPLLGLTWVFGLFAVNENTVVFAWLFTIFNSLQVNYCSCQLQTLSCAGGYILFLASNHKL